MSSTQRKRIWLSLGAIVAFGAALSSCNKTNEVDAVSIKPTASGESATAPSGSVAVPPSPRGFSGRRWEGKYVAKQATVTPPTEAKEKTWTLDPGTAAIGGGSIDLAVTGQHGEVTGTAHGALGEAVLSGLFDGVELRTNVTAKNPSDPAAMTGWMRVRTADDAGSGPLEGTLLVSGHDAKIVREATVTLDAK